MAKQFAVVSLNKTVKPTQNPYVSAPEINYSVPAAARGIDMLLAKYRGQKYQSEVVVHTCAGPAIPNLKKDLREARIALVTDGGLVPAGNPDNLLPTNATNFCICSIRGKKRLDASEYEISHQGYDNQTVLEDPNRLLPVDVLRDLESEGVIGSLSENFYSTAGVMTSVENSSSFGRQIASRLLEDRVDAVILSSTCGTSTRCGAYMIKEIEHAGIPTVHVTNLTKISEGIGSSRIVCGNNICHVFGNPRLSPEAEVVPV